MDVKAPPNNLHAEQSVLGSVLIDPNSIYVVADLLQPRDYYRQKHEWVFDAMLELLRRNEPIDTVTLSDELENRDQLNEIGGHAYICLLYTSPSPRDLSTSRMPSSA